MKMKKLLVSAVLGISLAIGSGIFNNSPVQAATWACTYPDGTQWYYDETSIYIAENTDYSCKYSVVVYSTAGIQYTVTYYLDITTEDNYFEYHTSDSVPGYWNTVPINGSNAIAAVFRRTWNGVRSSR